MDRQGSAQTTNGDEEFAEVRLRGQEFRELVEDDEERRKHGIVVFPSQTVLFVIGDVGVVTRVAQDLLATNHFTVESVLHTINQGQFRFQVRNHGRDVGQIRHTREGRATLEVDQNEVELFGRVSERQGQDQGTQHFGLT